MLPKDQVFQIGPFSFSRARGLWRGRAPVPLRHLERQLLKVLLDRPNEIVRKEEIIPVLWPETFVEDNTLNVLVRRLRVVLGDLRRPNRLLKSVPRIGFMIVATPGRKVPAAAPQVHHGDRSRFVRDVTIPDGAILTAEEAFEKVWEIQNIGRVPWVGRQLRRVGVARGPGRLTSEPTTPVPVTKPGELCLIRMSLVAPPEPGSYYAAWKMIDADGRLCFPRARPIFVSIDVVGPNE